MPAYDDGNTDLHKVSAVYRSRIELRHNQGIVIHSFLQKEAEDCLQSLRQLMSCLKLVIYIDVTSPKLKYLKINKQDVMQLCEVNIETFESSPPRLKLEGMRSKVERSRKVLQQLLNNILSVT